MTVNSKIQPLYFHPILTAKNIAHMTYIVHTLIHLQYESLKM